MKFCRWRCRKQGYEKLRRRKGGRPSRRSERSSAPEEPEILYHGFLLISLTESVVWVLLQQKNVRKFWRRLIYDLPKLRRMNHHHVRRVDSNSLARQLEVSVYFCFHLHTCDAPRWVIRIHTVLRKLTPVRTYGRLGHTVPSLRRQSPNFLHVIMSLKQYVSINENEAWPPNVTRRSV